MLFDFGALPAAARYKLVTSTIVPRPIAWVVSQDEQGTLNAAPFSFFNAFSDDPVVVGIGIGPTPAGDTKNTLSNIRATGQFTVNLVNEKSMQGMNVCAIDFPASVNELQEAGLTAHPSSMVRPPRIAESPVNFECETFELLPVGHHTIVLGRVLALHVRDDCVMDAERQYIDTPKLGLVGRMHGRGWYSTTKDRVEMPRMTVQQWEERKAETR